MKYKILNIALWMIVLAAAAGSVLLVFNVI